MRIAGVIDILLNREKLSFNTMKSKKMNSISYINHVIDKEHGAIRTQINFWVKDEKRFRSPYSVSLLLSDKKIEVTLINGEMILIQPYKKGVRTSNESPTPFLMEKFDALVKKVK